jgi:hypothetical protein
MKDHAVRRELGWSLRGDFALRGFEDIVGYIGHGTALPLGFMVKRRDQMPFDGG